MAEFNYTQFPIPARPLSGVAETNYASAILAVAPGGVKKVATDNFLKAAGIYPLGFVSCAVDTAAAPAQINVGDGTTMVRIPMKLYLSEAGQNTASECGLTINEDGEVLIAEDGMYRITASMRFKATGSITETNLFVTESTSTCLNSGTSDDDSSQGCVITCPPIIANCLAGDKIGLFANCKGSGGSSVAPGYVQTATFIRRATESSYLLVERLTNASGAPSDADLDEIAAEVEDARIGYDGTTYPTLGDAVREQIGAAMNSGGGLTEEIKQALLQLASKVAYIDDDGQTYYDELEEALYPVEPPATLVSISAVFDQTGVTIYDTDSLDTLKQYLTVTAHWSNSTTSTVTAYVLSGTLEEGISTITVTYNGKTDTFDVVVTETIPYELHDYVYRKSNVSGDAWVDTGLVHSPSFNTLNLEFEATNSNTTSTTDGLMGASAHSTSGLSTLIWYARGNKGGFSTFSLGSSGKIENLTADARYIVKYFFNDGGQSYIQTDDKVTNIATVSKSSIPSGNLGLVLAGSYGTSNGQKFALTAGANGKLGYVKFTDPTSGDVVYHFIPAYDPQQDRSGFYERINKIFYPAGSAALGCGDWT